MAITPPTSPLRSAVLALVGRRAPPSLRIFLLALAVIDDLGAIVLIAVLFTQELSLLALLMAGACLALLLLMNRAGVMRLWPYLLIGFLLWLSVLRSGFTPRWRCGAGW
jgi:NhaA family Na+:H+ antiporter